MFENQYCPLKDLLVMMSGESWELIEINIIYIKQLDDTYQNGCCHLICLFNQVRARL